MTTIGPPDVKGPCPEDRMKDDPDDRLDVHNRSIDESVAQAHLCGMTDLRTGRTCIRPARHPASCAFVSKDAALTIIGDDS
jgi:hypothetical protein